jgi:hypothetical protein
MLLDDSGGNLTAALRRFAFRNNTLQLAQLFVAGQIQKLVAPSWAQKSRSKCSLELWCSAKLNPAEPFIVANARH